MVKCLQAEGVSTIFGYPGGAILPFYDALRDETSIRHILTAHEQERRTLPTAMPERAVLSVSAARPPARGRRTSSPDSRMLSSTRSRSSPSPVR